MLKSMIWYRQRVCHGVKLSDWKYIDSQTYAKDLNFWMGKI